MSPGLAARFICEEVSEVEFLEPMGSFGFQGQEYPHWGNPAGRASTVDYDKGKFNRYAKLGKVINEIVPKLINIINKNYSSLDARCAYACLLMLKYGIRVGNEDSAEGYESGLKDNLGEIVYTYGVTTLENRHIKFQDNKLLLNFLGKEQVQHDIQITERFLVGVGKLYWRNSPDDLWLGINYGLIFDFIKQNIGNAFVPKDMRTFCANVVGWQTMQRYLEKPKNDMKSDAKKEVREIVEIVAKRLGNTPSVARSRYLDPRMLDWFLGQRWIGLE